MMHAGKYTARDQGGIGSKWGTRNTVLALVVKPHLLYGVNVQISNGSWIEMLLFIAQLSQPLIGPNDRFVAW